MAHARHAGTFIGLALIMLSACNTQGAPGGGDADLQGEIKIDGSSTVYPISAAIAETFQGDNSGVNVAVGQSGTGGGFAKFCAGEIDIADASRTIEPDEHKACKEEGIDHAELKIALDGISVVVNTQNDFLDCLTLEELKRIWEPDSSVKTWKDVRDSFPAEDIKLYGPGADSGTFDYFTNEIVGDEGSSRDDYTASENDNQLVRGVVGDRYALGYFGYAYFIENSEDLKAIGVGDDCVRPTEDSIESGDYKPLSRPLYIYVSEASLEKDHVKLFTQYYLDNVSDVAPQVGYIALPTDDLEASQQTLGEAIGE